MPTLPNSSSISGRRTLVFWLCPASHRNPGDARFCLDCGHDRIEKHAQVAAAERSVVYVNPLTGEHKTPPRADQPIPDVYARQGFERREITSMVAWEKESGSIHEASSFAPGNEPSPEREVIAPKLSKAVREDLIRDVMDARQSGNWTMSQPLSDGSPD